jgi:hypothetical protein
MAVSRFVAWFRFLKQEVQEAAKGTPPETVHGTPGVPL